jgi:hypothetical protein
VRSRLSQALLDNLAMAWSQLDRARPRHHEEVPGLLRALDEWMRWAMRVDDELLGALGAAYATTREVHPGGLPIPGVRHAYDLTERQGHSLDMLVTVTAGSPAILYEVVWRRYEELPLPDGDTEGGEAYRLHLASQPARTSAAQVTTFLLSSSVASGE